MIVTEKTGRVRLVFVLCHVQVAHEARNLVRLELEQEVGEARLDRGVHIETET